MKSKSRAQSHGLIPVAVQKCLKPFLGLDDEAYVDVVRGKNGRQTYLLASSSFADTLRDLVYEVSERPLRDTQLGQVRSLLRAKARAKGVRRPVSVRVGGSIDSVYLDLGSKDGGSVHIGEGSWRRLARSRARFVHRRGMLELPAPVAGGSLDELRELLGITSETTWATIALWLLSAFLPDQPHPILEIIGPAGSGKSFAAKVLRELVDPARAALRRPAPSERDLAVAARNNWIVSLNNVSQISVRLSDALCAISTDGGFATRANYTDDDEAVFEERRPIIVTAVDDVIHRPDLISRTLVVAFPERSSKTPERQLRAKFEEARPRILGALLDVLAGTLNALDAVDVQVESRLADFAVFAMAAAAPLKLDKEVVERVVAVPEKRYLAAMLAHWPAFEPLRDVLATEGGRVRMQATDLHERLTKCASPDSRKMPGWPANGRSLSQQLNRLRKPLAAEGITFRRDRPREGKQRTLVRFLVVEAKG